MITKAAIVWMFLNCHDLDSIVTSFFDARQDIFFKLSISANFLSILSHTNMTFINEQWINIRFKAVITPIEGVLRTPNLSGENFSLIVLHNASCPSRNTLTAATIPINFHLVEVAVLHCLLRQNDFPIAGTWNFFEAVGFFFFPVIEVANQENGRSIWCPLTEHPTIISLVKTEIEVTACKF